MSDSDDGSECILRTPKVKYAGDCRSTGEHTGRGKQRRSSDVTEVCPVNKAQRRDKHRDTHGDLAQNQQQNQRQMRMFERSRLVGAGTKRLVRDCGADIPRRGERDTRVGRICQKWCCLRRVPQLGDVDHLNADGLMRTRLNAGRRFSRRQPLTAHVALANNAFRGVILRDFVRTSQSAVLTAETLIIQMPDDACDRVFFIRIDRTGTEATRIDAMMTRRGDVLKQRRVLVRSDQQANIAK